MKKLQDGDIIKLEITPNTVAADQIEIGLSTAKSVTFWKGIQLDDLVVVEGDNLPDTRIGQVSVDVFESRELHLWKGKSLLDIHTDEYDVTDAHAGMSGGNRYVFEWLKD